MLAGVDIICFAASYTVALILEISRLAFRSGIRGAVMLGFAGAGLVAHSAYLYYRAVQATGAPLSSESDWYIIAAWVLVVVYLYLVHYHPKTAFGCFLLPLALVLIAAGCFLANPEPLDRVPASRIWGIIHGLSILLATVSVLIGFVAGVMYLEQTRRLKLKRPPKRGLRLPSLEWLARTNSRAIVISVIMMGVELASGMILNRINYSRQLARLPWNDPLVLSTQIMFVWLLLSAVLGAVYKPARHGRKVAYLTLVSFVFLVFALGAGLLLDTSHWGPKQDPPPEETPASRSVGHAPDTACCTRPGAYRRLPPPGGSA